MGRWRKRNGEQDREMGKEVADLTFTHGSLITVTLFTFRKEVHRKK